MNRKINEMKNNKQNCQSLSFIRFVQSRQKKREKSTFKHTGSTSVHVFDFNWIDLLFISNKINYFHLSFADNSNANERILEKLLEYLFNIWLRICWRSRIGFLPLHFPFSIFVIPVRYFCSLPTMSTQMKNVCCVQLLQMVNFNATMQLRVQLRSEKLKKKKNNE